MLPHTTEVVVRKIAHEAEGTLSFELMHAHGRSLPPFTAGAHIRIGLPGGLERSYSLVNEQGENGRYVIAVALDAASRGGSRYMHEVLRVNDTLGVSEPRNNFELHESAQHSVFIAGGIGITPVLCMIRRLQELGRSWELHYATRSRRHAAYLGVVTDLARSGHGRVVMHFDDERPGELLNVQAVVTAAREGSHLYCCGPAPMLAVFEQSAATWPAGQVHVEYFAPVEAPSTGNSYHVVLARAKRAFVVRPDQTLLHALLAQGMDIPYSCQEGTCGTCEVRVLEGKPDHRDVILSAAEKSSNRMMMSCCSGSLGDTLVLDL